MLAFYINKSEILYVCKELSHSTYYGYQMLQDNSKIICSSETMTLFL